MKYKCKKTGKEVEAVSFKEFIEHGINNSSNIVDGVPWSFSFRGYPVTHENDSSFIISFQNRSENFKSTDILIISKGCIVEIFNIYNFLQDYEILS